MGYLKTHKLLFHNEHGFGKSYPCETQSLAFLRDIHKYMNMNNQTDAIFIDSRRAFEKVSRSPLVKKITQLNFHPLITFWITYLFSNTMQYAVINCYASTSCNVSPGVPQGSVLGPYSYFSG